MAAEETTGSRLFDGKHDAWEAHVDSQLWELQTWKAEHMSKCHPAILTSQGQMEGRWAIIAGFCFGVGLALGFVASEVIRRWLSG